jgi:two-component system OmpR family response regulator
MRGRFNQRRGLHNQMSFRPPQTSGNPKCTLPRYILLLDDNRSMRQFAGNVLKEAGYEVLEAGDAYAAAALIQAHGAAVRLLIVDVFLPDVAGLDFVNWLDHQYPQHAPILYVSGENESVAVRAILRGNPNGILLKPFLAEQLLRRVELALREQTERSGGSTSFTC